MAVLRGRDAILAAAAKKGKTLAAVQLKAETDAAAVDNAYKMTKEKGAANGRESLRKAPASKGSTVGTGGVGNLRQGRWGAYSVEAFDLAMSKFDTAIPTWTTRFYRDYLEDLFTTIVGLTPIKTGRARANWQIDRAVGTSSIIEREDRYPNPIPPGIRTIRRLRKASVPMYIFNNVMYISNLEAGSSSQAPAGMVEPALVAVSARMGGYIDAMDVAISLEDAAQSRYGRHL